MRCLSCDTEIPDLAKDFCPSCRAELAPGSLRVASARAGAVLSYTPSPLASGTLIANRYRIVRRLGGAAWVRSTRRMTSSLVCRSL
jgi:hypothetical protein